MRVRRVAELQLLVLTMTVLSSWLWWWWRVTAVTCCPAQCQLTTVWPAAGYWCTADSLALAPHWHHQHTGHTGCSQLTATSQHLQHHTGEAEAEYLASTGDIGDTGVRRRERCPGGSPGTAGAGRVFVAVCWLLSAMVPQPSFVINKLTPLQLQHLGPATRLVTLLTLALQP